MLSPRSVPKGGIGADRLRAWISHKTGESQSGPGVILVSVDRWQICVRDVKKPRSFALEKHTTLVTDYSGEHFSTVPPPPPPPRLVSAAGGVLAWALQGAEA